MEKSAEGLKREEEEYRKQRESAEAEVKRKLAEPWDLIVIDLEAVDEGAPFESYARALPGGFSRPSVSGGNYLNERYVGTPTISFNHEQIPIDWAVVVSAFQREALPPDPRDEGSTASLAAVPAPRVQTPLVLKNGVISFEE